VCKKIKVDFEHTARHKNKMQATGTSVIPVLRYTKTGQNIEENTDHP
jgi:hypothetical protein